MTKYEVSKDNKSGLWYCHMKGFRMFHALAVSAKRNQTLRSMRRCTTTTGADRTGCMFCGYGCHLEKGEGRFERLKRTHPKQYEFIMKPVESGGLGYKEVIDWINEHGKLNIKY